MYRIQVEKATGYPVKVTKRCVPFSPISEAGRAPGRSTSSSAGACAYPATPLTVDRLCAPLDTNGYVSCYHKKEVVLNVMRWREGAAAWKGKLLDYRRYLINHEVSHALGRRHSTATAPVGRCR